MTTLYISLFGHGCVRYGESPPLKLSRSSLSLLAYLLLHPAPVPRELLQEVFWANQPPDRGRSSLATAIWRLRNSLETDSVPVGAYLLAGNDAGPSKVEKAKELGVTIISEEELLKMLQ